VPDAHANGVENAFDFTQKPRPPLLMKPWPWKVPEPWPSF
jgi:hypothetical protein